MAEDTTVTTAPEVEQPKVTKSKGKKGKRIVQAGEAHIQAPFNNTIISVTDKKGTAYAAQIAAEKVAEIAKRDHGMNSVDVFVKGIGLGRDSAIRAFSTMGISINSITDKTPIPHGGCRPKGERKP